MLRVTTIYASAAGSAADYYTKYLADSPGEAPGEWSGRQAAVLGLAGEVSGDDLRALLEGRDPVSGTPLGRTFADRTLANGKVVRAVAGFDATFSAPKSLSVLWALTQDDRLLDAHEVAVRAALDHLERYGATTRVRSRNGRLHPDAIGLTMATFRQTTSRSDDPQIHTHAVISSKVQTDDHSWLALDARYLKRYQRMLGGLYQSVLRNELAHLFGAGWAPIEHGQAEMLGVPAELCEAFSKRSVQVERAIVDKRADFIDRQGREPNRWELAALKREAAADTRTSKTGNAVTDLTTRWANEAAALGWTGPELRLAAVQAGIGHGVGQAGVRLDEIVATLSTGGSTWNRADVVSAVCDIVTPNRDVDGAEWAQMIERVADAAIERCVDLDPTNCGGPRRRSDGRSLWLEPTASHITTNEILSEEELVLSWALDAQTDEPAPSHSVDAGRLDVLQAEAARAVAGFDRLVLIVGPAGAGKTTTLRAAVEDLRRDSRAVFGVAPSAKAARVLERETGVPSDTLAKLLHEWKRADRPPGLRYQLPAGATVLVDEAGMVGTPALARLVSLATEQGWRLALIGDPHQLQAVGRGGLFNELCVTGRAHELQRIHRFAAEWEAAASLQLRHGDPRGWDAYVGHGRVFAGTFDDHVSTIAHRWATHTAKERTVAVVASTNEHVDALNAAIQQLRIDLGQLDADTSAGIAGGERAMIGDHVVTRRNDRRIVTDHGEPIRNRELWTVTDIGHDGSLTVTANRGHATAVLPVEYIHDHVRLGYAATEHGVQGDTTTIGMELVSPATTRRGAYVGLTRGCQNNSVFVVTESHDLDEARDILDRVITTDRADVPATTQRRELAAARSPARPSPRCEVPDWLPSVRADIAQDATEVERRYVERQAQIQDLRSQIATAEQQRAAAQRRLDPHQPGLDAAHAATRAAQEQVWSINNRAWHLKGRRRRAADRELRDATQELADAKQREEKLQAAAAPARRAVGEAGTRAAEARWEIHEIERFQRWDGSPERAAEFRSVLGVIDEWEHWARGKPVTPERVVAVINTLGSESVAEHPACAALANAVERWALPLGIVVRVAPGISTPQPPSPGPSLGIEM
jgi:conjugative relaxase-like TrwC/TraI family protein